jgi:transcriptional regulator with XRE-family HTH domain
MFIREKHSVPEVAADRRPPLSLHEESVTFGRRLKILRTVLEFSQADLGNELDITGQNVGRIESGAAQQVSIHTLFRLMDLLARVGLDWTWFTSNTAFVPGQSAIRDPQSAMPSVGSPASPSAGDALPAPAVPAEKSPEP